MFQTNIIRCALLAVLLSASLSGQWAPAGQQQPAWLFRNDDGVVQVPVNATPDFLFSGMGYMDATTGGSSSVAGGGANQGKSVTFSVHGEVEPRP